MRWIVLAAVVLAAVGGVAAYVLTLSHTEMVELELRAKPVATIRWQGKNLGSTPKKLRLPKRHEPTAFEATFVVHKVNAMTGQKKSEIFTQTVTVTPDHVQTIDFDLALASRVGSDRPSND